MDSPAKDTQSPTFSPASTPTLSRSHTSLPYSTTDLNYADTHKPIKFGSKSTASTLPSLPTLSQEFIQTPSDDEDVNYSAVEDNHNDSTTFVQFDFNAMKSNPSLDSVSQTIVSSNRSKTNLAPNTIHESQYVEFNLTNDNKLHDNMIQKFISPHTNDTDSAIPNDISAIPNPIVNPPPKPDLHLAENGNEDDFFNDNNWKSMKTFTEIDYYNEKGELEFETNHLDSFANKAGINGYTKIDTEEQVAKYSELDKKTDFLFKIANESKHSTSAEYGEEDIDYEYESDYDTEDNIDSHETLKSTKEMLTESQRFAYVGLTKLITVDMATNLAKLKFSTSNKIAKDLSQGQRNFSNWTMYIMSKLYDHMGLQPEENNMIESLSKHGVEVGDLSSSLLDKSISQHVPEYDVRWIIICDLFLLLLSDGYYDARSRTLLVQFADIVGISSLEILQFERRLIETLELEIKDKTIENDDTKLGDRQFIEKRIKKNRKKRLAYIGLATLGGGLAIGLSAGLLAPVIGAGIGAGLTTIGISGTTGFLAGVGGSAIITTTGVAIGAKVGSKAGIRRAGDVHTFELKPLHNNKRTNLVITVSGWMNGDMDDVRLPFSTVDPVMGDMFSLLWEPEMLRSMGQTITILASEALSTSIQQILGATILTALMSAIQLPMVLSKLSYLIDNPWNVSLDRAWKAGIILADTIISGNVGVRPITLVGFSLGSRLIYSCLHELAKRGGYGLIENVILLGNPIAIKTDQLALARSIVSGRFINGYSTNDWILGYLFRATSGGLSKVAGLGPINAFDIENVDCTNLIEGHMGYRSAIPKIMKEIGWEILSENFVEIEEPDLEQKERQRKLLSEFDEARAKMEKEKREKSEKKTWKDWFKPKNKDWWDIRENAGNNRTSLPRSSSSFTPAAETEPYVVEPMFDVDALQQEVQQIVDVAEHKATPADATEFAPTKLHLNEDDEADTDALAADLGASSLDTPTK